MATEPYQEILKRAQSELSAEEQNLLSAELAQSAARSGRNGKSRSLLELEGLGKEVWKEIDPERDSLGDSPRTPSHRFLDQRP